MKAYKVLGTKSYIVEARSPREAAVIVANNYAVIVSAVEDRPVAGWCESCRVYLFEGEDYAPDESGGYVCQGCLPHIAD